MGSREEFIRKYADADVNGRLEIILKNYPRFMQMVDGYEQCLSIIIRNEREYNRSRKGEDLGVRVQTSRLSNPTERQAIENVSIQEAIRAGDVEAALKGADDYEKHAVEIKTLVNMREDYQILTNQFLFLEDKEGAMFSDYISKRRSVAAIADDEGLAYETIRWRLKETRKLIKRNASEFLVCKYKCR